MDEAIDSIARGERGAFNPILVECLKELRNSGIRNTKEKFVKTMIDNRRKKATS